MAKDGIGAINEWQLAKEIEAWREPANLKPRHPSSQKFMDLLKELGDLHTRKMADYGREDDPFSNVKSAEEWGQPAWVGAMIRATDKMRRLQTLARRGDLKNEAARDAFLDLAGYALIGLVLYEEGK